MIHKDEIYIYEKMIASGTIARAIKAAKNPEHTRVMARNATSTAKRAASAHAELEAALDALRFNPKEQN